MRPLALPPLLHVANEGAAFLLEAAALVALGWWGSTRGTGLAAAALLGVGAPLAAAVGWGLFAAPKARVRLPMAGVIATKALVFGAASAALWALRGPSTAVPFAVTTLVNAVLAAFDRDALVRTSRR